MISSILWWLLSLYLWVLVIRIVFSFVSVMNASWTPKGPVLVVVELCYTLTDPPIKALRRWIRPLQLGGIQFDLSVLALVLGIQLLQHLLRFLPF